MQRFLFWVLWLAAGWLSAEQLTLDVMFTNDIHGGIDRYPATFMNAEFPPMIGGGASAAAYIKEVRDQSDHRTRDNLLLDAGDFFQGHPVGSVSHGAYVIEYMNKIGYEGMTLGNHEFDIGYQDLKKTLAMADFPILSGNVVFKSNDALIPEVHPWIIVEKMGVKIGIIGITTTDTEQMSFADNIAGLDFTDEKVALEKYIPEVKAAGADIVVLLGHLGLPYDRDAAYQERYGKPRPPEPRRWGYDAQELAHEVKGVDLIIGGHIHKGFDTPWVDPLTHTLVVQGYAYGSNVGHIMLKIDKDTKTLAGYDLPSVDDGMMVTLTEDAYLPDPEFDEMISARTAQAEAGMDEPVGVAQTYLSRNNIDAQSAIGNLVVDAMMEAGKADFGFINLGGIRGEIAQGTVTYRDVFNVMPFDNQVVVLKITGRQLREILEMRVSGSRHGLKTSAGTEIVYNKTLPDYHRITKLVINGQPWQPDRIYRVATTDFLLSGNAGLTMLTRLPDDVVEHPELALRDAMVNYIKRHSPVSAQIDNRWKRDDSSTPESYLNY